MNDKPIIALDFSTSEEIKNFLLLFKDEPLYVKVGMELYYQHGAEIVKWIKSLGPRDLFGSEVARHPEHRSPRP